MFMISAVKIPDLRQVCGGGVTQLAPARQSRHHDLTYTHPLASPSVETSYMRDRFKIEVFTSGVIQFINLCNFNSQTFRKDVKISLAIPQTLSHVPEWKKIRY